MPSLLEFIKEHQHFGKEQQKVVVVTDDKNIMKEINSYSQEIDFVYPEPAPTRIVDKVKFLFLLQLHTKRFYCADTSKLGSQGRNI